MRARNVNHVAKKTCLVRDSISIATTTLKAEACLKIFKIQKSLLNYDYEKNPYLLKCEVCGETPKLGKEKLNFVIGSIIIEVNIERLRRVIGKFLRNYSTLAIALMVTVAVMVGTCNF